MEKTNVLGARSVTHTVVDGFMAGEAHKEMGKKTFRTAHCGQGRFHKKPGA